MRWFSPSPVSPLEGEGRLEWGRCLELGDPLTNGVALRGMTVKRGGGDIRMRWFPHPPSPSAEGRGDLKRWIAVTLSCPHLLRKGALIARPNCATVKPVLGFACWRFRQVAYQALLLLSVKRAHRAFLTLRAPQGKGRFIVCCRTGLWIASHLWAYARSQ